MDLSTRDIKQGRAGGSMLATECWFLLQVLCPIRTKAKQQPPYLRVIQQQLQLAGMQHPRLLIKLEPGLDQEGAQQERLRRRQQQQRSVSVRQRLAEGGGAAAAPHAEWQAAPFQGMEQARVLGERLQQVLVECQARMGVTEATHTARVTNLEAEITRLQAQTTRLQTELARCAAETLQMALKTKLDSNRLLDQIASMQQQHQQQKQLQHEQQHQQLQQMPAPAPLPSQLQQVLISHPISLFIFIRLRRRRISTRGSVCMAIAHSRGLPRSGGKRLTWGTRSRSSNWASCSTKVKAWRRTKQRPRDSTAWQQHREMQMRRSTWATLSAVVMA